MKIKALVCLLQFVFSLVAASVVIVSPLDENQVFFADRHTVWTQSERLRLQVINKVDSKLENLKRDIDTLTIQIKSVEEPNQHTLVPQHSLYSYPYSSSVCSLIMKTKKDISDNNQRLVELDKILFKVKSTQPKLPLDCYPKSAKQLARMVHNGKEFRFNSALSGKIDLTEYSGFVNADTTHVELKKTENAKSSVTIGELLSSHSVVTEFLFSFDQSEGATVKIETETKFPASVRNLAPMRPHGHNSKSKIYIENGRNVYETYETDKVRDELSIQYSLNVVSRQVLNKGLHRELKTLIRLDDIIDNCNDHVISLYEHFPTGVYVDIYELNELRRVNLLSNHSTPVFDTFVFNDKVSVETSSLYSAPLYVKFDVRAALKDGVCTAELNVPIHFRYQEPSFDLFKEVIVSPPQTIVSRTGTQKDLVRDDFNFIDEGVDSLVKIIFENNTDKPIIINIPVGQLTDQAMITNFTLAMTVLCAIVLCIVPCFSKSK